MKNTAFIIRTNRRRGGYTTPGLLALAAVAAATLLACSNQPARPLHAMRSDGDFRYDVGDYAGAADHYQQYIDVKPSDPEIRYKLGRSYLEMGMYREARQNLQVAYDMVPDDERYIDSLAETLLKAGENEYLYAFLTKVVNERGRASDYLRLGEYGSKIGNPDDAVAALFTAAKLDGGINARYQVALARFYAEVGDSINEVQRLRMAYYLAPNNAEVLQRAAALGEIVGPTWALVPTERGLGQSPADTGEISGTAR